MKTPSIRFSPTKFPNNVMLVFIVLSLVLLIFYFATICSTTFFQDDLSSSTPPSTPSPPLSNFDGKSSAQSADERDFTEPRKGLIHPEPILPAKAPLPLHPTGPEPTRQSDNELLTVFPPQSPSHIEISSLTRSHPNPSRELNTFPVTETTSPLPLQPRPDVPLNLGSQKSQEARSVTPTRPLSLPHTPVQKQVPPSSSQTNSGVLSPSHTPLRPSSLPQSESQFQSPLSSKCHPLIPPPSLSQLPLPHSFPPHLPPPPHLTPLPPSRPDHVLLTRFPPEPVSESQVPPSHPPELVSIKQERQSPPCQSPKIHIERIQEELTLSNSNIPEPPPLAAERKIPSNSLPKQLERESTLPFRPHLLPLLDTTSLPDSLKSESQLLTPGASKMDQSLMSDIKIKTEPVEITQDDITEDNESDDDIPTGPEPEPTTCNKKIHESKSAM